MILFVKPNLFVISVIAKLETFKLNPEEGYMRVFLWIGLDISIPPVINLFMLKSMLVKNNWLF